MANLAAAAHSEHAERPKLDTKVKPMTGILFVGLLAAGILFTAYSIYSDMSGTQLRCRSCCSAFRCWSRSLSSS